MLSDLLYITGVNMWGVHMCAHAMAFEEVRGQFAVFSSLLLTFGDGTQVISFGGE